MKIVGLIGLILLSTVVLYSWGALVDDFEENYIETGISNTTSFDNNYTSTYNRRTDLNDTFYPLQEGFSDIKEDSGWFDKVQDLGFAIPITIIQLPGMIIDTVADTITDMSTIMKEIGIPTEIILIAGLGFIIFIIFKLVEFWRNYEA